MAIILMDLMGSPNIGIYSVVTESYAILPSGIPRRKVEKIQANLDVPVAQTLIGGTKLLGALMAGNSNGIILPHLADESEVEAIRAATGVATTVVEGKKTAFGNLILANDKGALVDPRLSRASTKKISDALGVEVCPATIADLPYVGSLGRATNRGAVVHPMASEEELRQAREVLKVNVEWGTVNQGVPFVASGLLANSRGAALGSMTTGPEIVVIGQALDIAAEAG